MAHVISPDDLSKKEIKPRTAYDRHHFKKKAGLQNQLCFLVKASSKGMVKLYFLLALLLGQIPLKAGRCNRNSIWLFVLHHG